MVWRLVVAVLLVVAAVVADGMIEDEPAAPRRVAEKPHVAGCAHQSIASFPGAFTSAGNLVVGPLALIGAGEPTTPATVREFGGNKFPAVVRAGRTVTVEVRGRRASLFYAEHGGVLTGTHVADGDGAVTFRSCGRRRAESDADGDPVTFWSGFVLVARPMCVRLTVRTGSARARRVAIPLGRSCVEPG